MTPVVRPESVTFWIVSVSLVSESVALLARSILYAGASSSSFDTMGVVVGASLTPVIVIVASPGTATVPSDTS